MAQESAFPPRTAHLTPVPPSGLHTSHDPLGAAHGEAIGLETDARLAGRDNETEMRD